LLVSSHRPSYFLSLSCLCSSRCWSLSSHRGC
jgi:hypothetical protein